MQNSKSKENLQDYFYKRFGVNKDYWNRFRSYEKGKSIWVVSKILKNRENFVASGIRALRIKKLGPKPTTYILQFLESKLNKNIQDISYKELEKLVFEREYIESELDTGFVALRYSNRIIGCGLMDSNGLRTQIPKGRSKDLEEVI